MAGTNFFTKITSTLWGALTSAGNLGGGKQPLLLAKCTGVPPTTANLFEHGCLMVRTDSGTGNKAVYENVGSSAVPSWNLIGDVTAGEITLALNNLLQGNSSGVAEAVTNITLPKEGSRTISVAATTTANTVGGSLTVSGGAGAGTGAGGDFAAVGGDSGTGATGNGAIASLTGGAALSTNGTGGVGKVVGGVGTGTGAGGASQVTGGVAGATGTGGAATVTGGAGGATSGAGGAATMTGGAGTAGNSTGGVATVTGGAGQGTASGAVASLVGGASGAGATGNGANALVTGGAAASTNGNGGSVVLAGGAKTGTGVAGVVYERSTVSRKTTVTAMTDTATIAEAAILGGVIVGTPTAAAAYTTPTGAVLAAALPSDFTTGDSVEFSIVNVATNDTFDITLTAGASGITLVGNAVVEANSADAKRSSAIFRAVLTGANTFSIYRIA